MKKELMSYDWIENIMGLQYIGIIIVGVLGLIMVEDHISPPSKIVFMIVLSIVFGIIFLKNAKKEEKKRR